MSLPPSPPPLSKWPFLLADAALLGAAWLIVDRAGTPLGRDALIAVFACVGSAGVIGAVPFLVDYARRQEEALDDRQRSLEALAATVAAAAEQISIAAGGFQEIADLAQKNLKHAELLPHKIQEKVAEFSAKVNNSLAEEKDELEREIATLRASESERLEATAEKIARAATEWSKAETAAQKHLGAAKTVLAEFDRRLAELKAAAPGPAANPPATVLAPVAAAVAEPAPPSPEAAPLAAETVPESAAPAASEEAPAAAPRKRATKKTPKPEEPALPLEDLETPASEFSSSAPEPEAPAVAIAADGATRLLVTAYIGIGNRLFIRGEGPGLSWDEGVPLQFVSIGKWRWETAEAEAPVRYKLYKNDQFECTALGSQVLPVGHQQDVMATF
jgi:cell division protein FtsB